MTSPSDDVTSAATQTQGNSPIFICGPTASGKTTLAIQTAHTQNGEIINADAFQLFCGIETLSAAPSAEEKSSLPHHLFGVLDPTEPIDAGRYLQMANPVIQDIQSRGKTPVIVGGSGLYLKFLTHGPSPLPQGDPNLRADLDQVPLDELVTRLQSIDPVEASRTALHNRRYVTRALEICLLTGQKASNLRDRWLSASRQRDAELRGILIQRSRPELHQRIAQRTRTMLDGGAIEEVSTIGRVSSNLEKAIGFREIQSLLAGEISLAQCAELINAATRQYAKRQETWFRRETWLRPS